MRFRPALSSAAWVAATWLAISPVAAEEGADPKRIVLETTLGNITLELDEKRAPKSTANFLQYVTDGYYDGTVFHRIISNFMIQGGGFTQEMQRKKTRDPIPNEADNGLRNARGSIAMARTQDPHSATAQFFINVVDNRNLDHTGKNPRGWGYAVFGRVVAGMEVVDKVKAAATTQVGPFRNVPKEPIIIKSARILTPEKIQ